MLRRQNIKFITSGAAILLSGLIKPIASLAKWNDAAFSAEHYATAVESYFPDETITYSEKIVIGVHPMVENGAVVPVKVETTLNNVQSITIFIEKNPNPLIANFDLNPNCLGFISTRIKMDQSSNIIAMVKTDTGVFLSEVFVEVLEGGCG